MEVIPEASEGEERDKSSLLVGAGEKEAEEEKRDKQKELKELYLRID